MKKRRSIDFLIGLIKKNSDENGEFDLRVFCQKNWQKLGYKSYGALYAVVAAYNRRNKERSVIERIPKRRGWYRFKKESLTPAPMILPESDDREDFSKNAERKISFFKKLGRKGIDFFILLDQFCKGEKDNRIAEGDLRELLLSELDEFKLADETEEEALERFLKIMIDYSLLVLVGNGAKGKIFELMRDIYQEYYDDIDIVTSLISCQEELTRLKAERKKLEDDVSVAEQDKKQAEEIYRNLCQEVDLLKTQLKEMEERKKQAEERLNSVENVLNEAKRRISTDNFEDQIHRLTRDAIFLQAFLEMDETERNAIFKKINQ